MLLVRGMRWAMIGLCGWVFGSVGYSSDEGVCDIYDWVYWLMTHSISLNSLFGILLL